MKTYDYQTFKNDLRTPRTRVYVALFDCIDNNKTSPEELFKAIDIAYSVGTHRSPHYLKKRKELAIKLLNMFTGIAD